MSEYLHIIIALIRSTIDLLPAPPQRLQDVDVRQAREVALYALAGVGLWWLLTRLLKVIVVGGLVIAGLLAFRLVPS